MGCPSCHEPYMIKLLPETTDEMDVALCGRCNTRFDVHYKGEDPDERKWRLWKREERRKAKELYSSKEHREEAIS